MEDEIKLLTTDIDDKCKTLIKDNKLLINGFKVRLIKRLLGIFNKYKIPFNKDILESTMTDYLINSFRDASYEVCVGYKKVLYKYFDIINEYYNTHRKSKDKIKNVTALFVKKIYGQDNPILTVKICNEFLSDVKSRILVYDNYDLIKEVETKIKEDVKDILHEMSRNNKDYLISSMKEILEYVLRSRDE